MLDTSSRANFKPTAEIDTISMPSPKKSAGTWRQALTPHRISLSMHWLPAMH